MKIQICLTLLIALSTGLSTTDVLGQLTLDFQTALQMARENNPDWKTAEQEIEAARGRLTTAQLISPFNPAVEAQGGPRRVPGERTGTDYGVGVSMEVEVAGQRGSGDGGRNKPEKN